MIYVNARAIIERESDRGIEVLMQLRDRPPAPREWEFPGGRLEPYEPILAALAREVWEETGLSVTAVLDDHRRMVIAGATADMECRFSPIRRCVVRSTRWGFSSAAARRAP